MTNFSFIPLPKFIYKNLFFEYKSENLISNYSYGISTFEAKGSIYKLRLDKPINLDSEDFESLFNIYQEASCIEKVLILANPYLSDKRKITINSNNFTLDKIETSTINHNRKIVPDIKNIRVYKIRENKFIEISIKNIETDADLKHKILLNETYSGEIVIVFNYFIIMKPNPEIGLNFSRKEDFTQLTKFELMEFNPSL